MTAHSEFSPSSAARWLNCPASVQACRGLPSSDSSFAREGTAAHALAALCLTVGLEPIECVGVPIDVGDEKFIVTEEMAHYVAIYKDAIVDRCVNLCAQLRVEESVNLASVQTDMHGTADAILITQTQIEVHDFKYGKGIQVSAISNSQLMLYAWGAYLELLSADPQHAARITDFALFIHQPRLDWTDNYWICAEALGQWIEQTKNTIANALSNSPTFNPGEEQCRWCPFLPQCPAAAQRIAQLTGATFGDLDAQDESTRLSYALSQLDFVQNWVQQVKVRADELLKAGETIPGFKLVAGRGGNRKWNDEDVVEKLFREQFRLNMKEMYTFKLISPTDAERQFKDNPRRWEKLQEFITRGPTSLIIVAETDKRPAVNNITDFPILEHTS